MVLLTMIARLADGLPLAASMQEDEQVEVLASLSVCVAVFCVQAAINSFSDLQ